MPSTAADAGTVHSTRDGAVTVLTLAYPARRNALSMPLREALETQLQQAMADPDCRVLVLTGEGGHFCSGGDISSFGGVTPASGRVRMQRVHRIVRHLVRGEKPVVAAVGQRVLRQHALSQRPAAPAACGGPQPMRPRAASQAIAVAVVTWYSADAACRACVIAAPCPRPPACASATTRASVG
jgi:hypothetical protein